MVENYKRGIMSKKFVSAYDKARKANRIKSKPAKIKAFKKRVKEWGLKTKNPSANMVRIFSEMYYLPPVEIKKYLIA